MADISWNAPPTEPVGNWEGVGRSALWALPGLVGVRPPADLAEWQAEHKTLAFLSEVAPTLIPYLGWAKAAKAIGPLQAGLRAAVPEATMLARPFLGAAGREALAFAPFEAARLGAGALGGEALANVLGGQYEGTGPLAASTAFDLGLLGIGAGVGGLLGAGGKSELPFPGLPGRDLSEVPTASFRRYNELASAGRIEPGWTERAPAEYEGLVKEELGSAVGQLRIPDEELISVKALNAFARTSKLVGSLFTPTRVPGRMVRALTVGKKGFAEAGELQDFIARSEVSQDELLNMLYPRAIELTAPKSAERFAEALKKFTQVDVGNGRSVWLETAPPEGKLPTMLREVGGGKTPQWLAFQSETPDIFLGKATAPTVTDPVARLTLQQAVVTRVPEIGTKYSDDATLNRLFIPSNVRDIRTRMLTIGQRGFHSNDDVQHFVKQAGLPEDWISNVRFPRVLEAQTEHAAKKMQGVLGRFASIGDGWKMLYDSVDGTAMMAKTVRPGSSLIFKTDRPELFAKSAQRWLDSQNDATMRVFGKADTLWRPTGNEIVDTAAERMNAQRTMDLRGVRPDKPGWTYRMVRQIAPVGSGHETTRRAWAWVKKELAPLEFQFKKNPDALRVVMTIKEAEAAAQAQAQRLALGATVAGEVSQRGMSPLGLLWHQIPPAKGSVLDFVLNKLSAEEQTAMLQVLNAGEGLATAIPKWNLSENTVAALTKMLENDAWQVAQIAKAEAFGKVPAGKRLAARMDHFGWNRIWKGDLRVPLFGKHGLVGWFGGTSAKEALAAAEAGRVRLLAEGIETRVGHVTNVAETSDLEMLSKMAFDPDFKRMQGILSRGVGVRRPGTFNERTGTLGFETAFTRQELADAIVKHYERNARYQADIGIKALVAKEFDKIAKHDPVLGETLQQRMDLLRGKRTADTVNKSADLVLNRVLGNQSASKITSGLNAAMHRLQFGFWNLGYVTANLLNFVQTGLPHLAFLASAPPERLANEYSAMLVRGRPVWSWDIMKSVGRSFGLLGSKDPEFMSAVLRGAQEGVWRPKFIEEFVGEHAITKQRLAAALKGEEPMSELLRAAVDLSGTSSEMFSRLHAFALGWDFFGRVMGVVDKDLQYQYAKRFVEKTMFGYSQGDRAALMTGPFGSLWGMWKNWPLHYLGWMMQYAGEGVKYGNWKPMLWMMSGTGVLGGVGALPFIGTYNALAGWMGNDGAMAQVYDAFGGPDGQGKGLADTVWYGVPALLGVSLQNQMASPLNDPANDASRFMGVAAIDRAAWLGKAIGEGWDKAWATGQNPLADQRTRELLAKAVAPNALLRLGQAIADDSYRSVSTGQPLARWSGGERALHALGFSPVEMAGMLEVGREVWQSKDKMAKRVETLGDVLAVALQEGNSAMVERVVRQAVAESVDPGRVVKSATTRIQRGQQVQLEMDGPKGAEWVNRGFGRE